MCYIACCIIIRKNIWITSLSWSGSYTAFSRWYLRFSFLIFYSIFVLFVFTSAVLLTVTANCGRAYSCKRGTFPLWCSLMIIFLFKWFIEKNTSCPTSSMINSSPYLFAIGLSYSFFPFQNFLLPFASVKLIYLLVQNKQSPNFYLSHIKYGWQFWTIARLQWMSIQSQIFSYQQSSAVFVLSFSYLTTNFSTTTNVVSIFFVQTFLKNFLNKLSIFQTFLEWKTSRVDVFWFPFL